LVLANDGSVTGFGSQAVEVSFPRRLTDRGNRSARVPFEMKKPALARALKQTMYSRVLIAALAACIAGCANFMPNSGPSADRVVEGASPPGTAGIQVLDVTPSLVQRLMAAQRKSGFAEMFGPVSGSAPPRYTIGAGDAVEVSVWEAPPAVLFGSAPLDSRGAGATSRMTSLPEQVVNQSGEIVVPFAGNVSAAGRTPQEVQEDIARKLKAKANDPQVLVRVLRNASNTVTIVGEVNTNSRFPLTPLGERLLDALASAGGFRQPVGKISVRITRDVLEGGRRVTRAASLPLESIITDPAQNIQMRAGDVVTVLYQPNSFTVLGATNKNEEINFEAQGITLAQALGRSGGLQDLRANATGIFIFRFEDPEAIGESTAQRTTADGRIPVIYWVDLKNPASFFLAQDFSMRNRDILYVANAPGAELQKFLNLLSSLVFPLNYYNGLK
jgi:polysaccharide biosynthesis/export protein